MDVIAVRYDDGTWKASPFHVRFGMFKVRFPPAWRGLSIQCCC
jgi:phosphatidate phosphatase PAH1